MKENAAVTRRELTKQHTTINSQASFTLTQTAYTVTFRQKK